MAKAVVSAAKQAGLEHEEMHSKVEYICLLYTSGEPITVIAHRKGGCVVSIKDGRYNIDTDLAQAISI